MQTSFKKPLVMATMASAAALMVACGGSDDSPTPTPPAATVTGKAVDFYLSGSTVTFTSCGNKTTTTDANGGFTFPAGCSSSALTVTGGTDIGTGLPFTGTLQAQAVAADKAGKGLVVTPLTTLAAVQGVDASVIAAKLGLSPDLTTVDPMTDKNLLKSAVVVQQLIDQVTKTLISLASSAGGSISQAAAANAAAKAVAAAIIGSSGTIDLGSTALVSAAVKGAVQNAAPSLPSSLQNNINTVAANVVALVTPTISTLVSNVSKAMTDNVTIGASAKDTLAALKNSGAMNKVAESASSTAVASAIKAVAPALTNGSLTSALTQLGNVVTGGSASDVSNAISNLGTGNVNQSAANDLVNAAKLNNYIALGNVSVNGASPVPYASQLNGIGTLTDVKVVLTAVGTPLASSAGGSVRAGLHYTYNNNTVDLIINNVTLAFNGSGALTGATVPAGTTYNFNIAGGVKATLTSTNNSADNLFAAGALDLPFNTFLAKLKSAGALSDAQIASLTPQAGGTAAVTFTMLGANGSTVTVASGSGNDIKSTGAAFVTAGTNTLNGNGVNFTLSLK